MPTYKKILLDSDYYPWEGAWVTATDYHVNDCVENDGSGYVCTVAHTSGASTEPGTGADWATKWDLLVQGVTSTSVNAAGAVMESDYNANTILAATSDDTPVTLTVGEQTVVGRITGGNIAALTPAQVRTMLNVTEGASGIPCATAAGTVDVITADYSPDLTLTDKVLCAFVASGANTSTTPTFAPDGLTAHTITKWGGSALAAGDIPAALAVCILEYNAANTRWELLNPKTAKGDTGTAPAGTLILTAQGAIPRNTNGCAAAAQYESATNKINTWFLAFDKATDEYAQWTNLFTPSDYDASHLHAQFVWHCASGVGGANKTVCWSIRIGCWANDTAIDTALGTAVTVTDTWLHDIYWHISDATAAITPTNAAASRHLVVEVMRDISEDDLDGDALLDEVILTFTRT